MTLQEIIQIKTINQLLNEQFTIYMNLTNDLTAFNGIKTFLEQKIEIAIQPYLDFETLFDQEKSVLILTMIFSRNFINMIKNSAVQTVLLDKSWLEFTNIGNDSNSSNNQISYAGYDVQNQDGQFQTYISESRSLGKRRLEYLIYLEQSLKEPIENLIKDIQENLLKLYY